MKNKEVEIRIVDLLAALLKAARPILCFALILTLLGAGYGLRKARGYTKTETGEFEAVLMAKGNVDTAKERLELARKALKRFNEVEYPSAETKCKQAERMVEQRQDYLDNSLYQALDPFNCGLATLTFCVESEGEMTVNPAIYDPLKKEVIYQRQYPITEEELNIPFEHKDTLEIEPSNRYEWDVKIYKTPVYADGADTSDSKTIPINGASIDSYYSAFSLPVCEIREFA